MGGHLKPILGPRSGITEDALDVMQEKNLDSIKHTLQQPLKLSNTQDEHETLEWVADPAATHSNWQDAWKEAWLLLFWIDHEWREGECRCWSAHPRIYESRLG